jgi:hypothetical protein
MDERLTWIKEDKSRWNTMSKASYLRESSDGANSSFCICQNGGHTNQVPVIDESRQKEGDICK